MIEAEIALSSAEHRTVRLHLYDGSIREVRYPDLRGDTAVGRDRQETVALADVATVFTVSTRDRASVREIIAIIGTAALLVWVWNVGTSP